MTVTPNNPMKITLCMGSSCFARGNGENLDVLEEFLKTNALEADVELAGSRCEGRCADGPNIAIGGTWFGQVDSGMMLDLLREFGLGAHHE